MGDPEAINPDSSSGSPGEPPIRPAPLGSARVFTTEQLFGDLREVWIQHGDMLYRLRITSTDKLVLTK